MSIASPIALPDAPAARAARVVPQSRLALLFGVILVTSVAAVVLAVASYVRPAGSGDSLPGLADIEPMRGYLWAFFTLAGVQLVVGVCAAGLAGLILTPARGAVCGTIGSSLIWLGAALYGVGIGGWASFYYFASDTSTLGTPAATKLVDHANDDTIHMLAIPISGAIVVTLGSIVLAVGVWRARTVPRWIIILGVASGLAAIPVPPGSVLGIAVETASSATTIALGWYAWRPWAGRRG